MATRQTGMTPETAAQIPASRAVVAQEVARQLAEIEEQNADDGEEIEMTSADRVSEMLQSDLGDRAYVRVYKMDDRTGQYEFCKDYTPAEFETNGNELIRTEWGYGKFRVVLYGNVPGTKRFTIRAKNDLSFAKPLTPTAVAVVPQQNSELSQVLAALVDGQNKMLQALTTQPQKDPMKEMTQMLTLMTTMREALGLNNQPQKTAVGELVEAIKELKGAASLIGGESEKEPSLLGLAPQLLDTIKSFVPPRGAQPQPQQFDNGQAFPQLSVPASLSAPAESQPLENPAPLDGAQSQPQPQPQQLPEDDPDMLEFLAFAARLKKDVLPLAGNMEKVNDVAELLEAKAPDQFFEVLEMDNWFEALTQYAPQFFPALVPVLANHREWLTAVRARVIELLKE